MLILCSVLLAIAFAGNAANPSLQVEVEPSAVIRLNEAYRLICIVNTTDQKARNVFWYKGRRKLESLKEPMGSRDGTVEVIHKIKKFGESDVGEYHCENKRKAIKSETLQLNYREQEEELHKPTVITPPRFNNKVCRTVVNGGEFKKGTLVRILYPPTPTSTVLSIKIRITDNKQFYTSHTYDHYRPYWTRYDHHKRLPRHVNETNLSTVNDSVLQEKSNETARQVPNDNTSLHDENKNDTSYSSKDTKTIGDSENLEMNITGEQSQNSTTRSNNDNILRTVNPHLNVNPGKDQNMANNGSRSDTQNRNNHGSDNQNSNDTYLNANWGGNQGRNTNQDPKAVISKLLSMKNEHRKDGTKESMNVSIKTKKYDRFPFYRTTIQKNLIVNAGNLTYDRNINQDHVKIQLVYDSMEGSTQMTLSGTTKPVLASFENVTLLDIGYTVAQSDISIKYEDITICKLVKPAISLKVEVKEKHVLLECRGTGPPFLTGVLKIGGISHGYVREGTPSQREDAHEQLVLTYHIKPSSLVKSQVYSCVFTSSAGGRAVRRIRIGGEEYYKEWNSQGNRNSDNEGNPERRPKSDWQVQEEELKEFKNSNGKH